MNGHIKRVVSDRGFGFIEGENGLDYFFHRSALTSGCGFESLSLGDGVVFEAVSGDKGPRAERVANAGSRR